MTIDIMRYESKVWSTADSLIGAGCMSSKHPCSNFKFSCIVRLFFDFFCHFLIPPYNSNECVFHNVSNYD